MARSDPSRKLYRRADLERLINPRSVAIVGVSQNPKSFGSETLANLEAASYSGSMYPINARYTAIGEKRCYPSVDSLPEVPDCVIVAVPRAAVEPVIIDCANRGVGGVVVYASGYVETGKPERIEQQARLISLARESGMRVLGPNCMGLLNFNSGFIGSFTLTRNVLPPRQGAIGLVSQSGAIAFSMAQSMQRGISFSHILTSGNACDVDIADQIAYLMEEPTCKVVACVFEGMQDPARLMEAASIAPEKPVIVYKIATGNQGAAAAMSHTGSLAGSHAAYRAAFARAGIIVVDTLEALIETSAFFAKAPRPKSKGVGVLATSGGACIMSADMAEVHGIALPQPGAATQSVLESVIPEFGSARNPCDVTAQVLTSYEALSACTEAMMADDRFGALVVPHPYAREEPERRRIFSEAAERHGKALCNVWLSEWLEGPGTYETEEDQHVALFRSMHRCFAAIAAWHQREDWLRNQPRESPATITAETMETATKLIVSSQENVLVERQAKAVLDVFGIPVVHDRLVQDVDAAVAAAQSCGYPVVLKVESPELPHKTEAGVIRLGLRNEEEVRQAYESIITNACKHVARSRVAGVLVQPMVASGIEVLIGARVDPQFGPLIVVGLGGIFVELLNDTVLELAPVTHTEAESMLNRLKGRALLTGFRGSAPVDLDKLADIVCRVSELIATQRHLIEEIDVNPLICNADGIMAVDALIVRRSERQHDDTRI